MSSALTAAAQKVNDLVRLAVDPGAADGEARNAALMACRLMAKHELVAAPKGAQAPRPGHPWGSPGPGAQRPPRREYRSKADDDGARTITSRYATSCKVCRGEVDEGERVYWRPGKGVAHIECGDDW